MSASSDSKQPAAGFIYTNFYEHYKNLAHSKGVILKSQAPAPATHAEVKVITPEHQKDMMEWSELAKEAGKKGISQSLLELRETRKRFQYLINELEDLVKA